MEEKIMSFLQFCEAMKNELLFYLPEQYRDGNHTVIIDEIKDNFDHISSFLRIENRKEKIFNTPSISMDAAYENLKIANNKDKIFRMVADKYDKMYSEFIQSEYVKYEGRADFDVHKLFAKVVSPEEATKDIAEGIYVTDHNHEYQDTQFEFHLLASDNGIEIRSCKLTSAQVEKCDIDAEELLTEAIENVRKLLPLAVRMEQGNPKYKLSDVYYISKPAGTTWAMYGNDVYEELAEKTGQDLLVTSVSDDTKLVFAVTEVKDMQDSLDALKEMKLSGYGFTEERFVLYGNQKRDFITDMEEITAIISKKERKLKSLFNR